MSAKKLLVLCLVPTVVMLATFGLFQLLRDSYTAEARLRIEPLALGDSLACCPMASEGRTDSLTRSRRYQAILRQLQQDTVLNLLSYHIAVGRLGHNMPFAAGSSWEAVNSPAFRSDMSRAFQRCLQELRSPLARRPQTDSLWQLLEALACTPDHLRDHLVIRSIPGTYDIRLQAIDDSPERSMFMVNRLGRVFVRYWVARQQAELEQSLADLAAQQAARELALGRIQARLELARAELYAGAGAHELIRLQDRVETLEETQRLLSGRVERLKAALGRDDTPQAVIRVRQQGPAQRTGTLRQELHEALTQLSLVEQELLVLRGKLAQADSAELAPLLAELAAAEVAYQQGQADWEIRQHALLHLPEMLTFIPADRSKVPSPMASYGLTLMAGLASLLLWALVLFQIGMFKWPQPRLAT